MPFISSRISVDTTSRNVLTSYFTTEPGPITVKNIGDNTILVGYADTGSSYHPIAEPGFPLAPGETCVLHSGALVETSTEHRIAAFSTDTGTSTLAYYYAVEA